MQESSKKLYVDAQTLLVDSIKLARMVWNDKFCPTVLVSVWRGGTLPGIATDEFFRCRGQRLHHAVIKAQSYDGMERGESGVQVEGIEDIAAIVKNDDRLLIIDDVFDTGHTMVAIMNHENRRRRMPFGDRLLQTRKQQDGYRAILLRPCRRSMDCVSA